MIYDVHVPFIRQVLMYAKIYLVDPYIRQSDQSPNLIYCVPSIMHSYCCSLLSKDFQVKDTLRCVEIQVYFDVKQHDEIRMLKRLCIALEQ